MGLILIVLIVIHTDEVMRKRLARSSPSPTMLRTRSSFQQGDVNLFQFLQFYILKSLDFDLSDPELTESATKLEGIYAFKI